MHESYEDIVDEYGWLMFSFFLRDYHINPCISGSPVSYDGPPVLNQPMGLKQMLSDIGQIGSCLGVNGGLYHILG